MATAIVEPETGVAELVREHQADVWRYLRYLGCQQAEADDLTQETFLAVLRRPFEQRSRGETAAYLRRVARNRMLLAQRQQGREPKMADLELAEEVWSDSLDAGHSDDWLDALDDCLETAITARVREAIALQYADNESRQKIGRLLDMTADGVKTMLRRARATLRECVERRLRMK